MMVCECKKCGSHNLAVAPNKKNPNATDLYCRNCGAWLKFATKDEIRKFEHQEIYDSKYYLEKAKRICKKYIDPIENPHIITVDKYFDEHWEEN